MAPIENAQLHQDLRLTTSLACIYQGGIDQDGIIAYTIIQQQ